MIYIFFKIFTSNTTLPRKRKCAIVAIQIMRCGKLRTKCLAVPEVSRINLHLANRGVGVCINAYNYKHLPATTTTTTMLRRRTIRKLPASFRALVEFSPEKTRAIVNYFAWHASALRALSKVRIRMFCGGVAPRVSSRGWRERERSEGDEEGERSFWIM